MAKISIPFKYYQGIGGPQTFMRNLKNYLDKEGYVYSDKLKSAEALFFPINFNHGVLRKIRLRGGRLIQRLDGIYYPSKHGESYISFNQDIKKTYLEFSDFIVFQSEYSKAQCFEMLGVKPQNKYTKIVNGVNKKLFFPVNTKKTVGEFIFTTTGNFRNLDMLAPVVKALDKLIEQYKFRFQIIGPITNESLEPYLNRTYIDYLGPKTSIEIAPLLRQADAFIYSHLNPPCPNSVLEAISIGLPIVGFNSGSMSELCHFNTDLLAYVSDEIFQKYEDFDPKKLAVKIKLLMDNFTDFQRAALANAHLYGFEECGKKYVAIFEQELGKVQLKPTIWDRLKQPFS